MIRLFIALVPGEAVRQAASDAARALRAAAGGAGRAVRWSSPGVNVHLTLAFLGEVEAARRPAVEQALAEAASAAPAPLDLTLEGAGGFPSSRHPRVLWLGVGGDLAGLSSLQAALARALAARGLPGARDRFSPHLTIGRSRSPRGAAGLTPALATPLPRVAWRVAELVLFESRLGHGPAVHLPLARAPLGST